MMDICFHHSSTLSYPLRGLNLHSYDRMLFFTKRRHFSRAKRRRHWISLVASSMNDSSTGVSQSSVFGEKKQLSGLHALIGCTPPAVRLVTSAVLLAGAFAAGYKAGIKLGGSQKFGLGGALTLVAAGSAAVYALNSRVSEVAAVNLHNFVASCDDPRALKKEQVEEIRRRHGVDKRDEAFNAELSNLYNRFVSSVIPPGGQNLKGDEVDAIIKFKNILGIDDPDAALVHMEIGRQIFRQRMEAGNRDVDIEQRRAFQKLIYVSNLVFGEASSFLLPWKRVFKVTDSQVEIAIRDNAQRLYAVKLSSVNRDVSRKQLIELREAQIFSHLSDEIAADMFRKRIVGLVEENISAALEVLKSRTRIVQGAAIVVQEIDKILALNKLLTMLSGHPEVLSFAPGVGPIALTGGKYDSERKTEDLKLLYRAYATELFSSGHIEENKIVALNHLKNIFGFRKGEAEAIVEGVSSKVYRKRLAEAISNGELGAAHSKAAFLQGLCDELHIDHQKAIDIHGEIYKQKLQQSVASGELTDGDVNYLNHLRVLLCIPQQTVDSAHFDICGTLFTKAVKEAIASGVNGYNADASASVRRALQGLRLTKGAATEMTGKAVRSMFMNYIKHSRTAETRSERVKELKKLIAFNHLVVTDLVADVLEVPTTADNIARGPEVTAIDEDCEWASLETLRKMRSTEEFEAKLEKPSQTVITLKDDVPERERADLYRDYLIQCARGEVIIIPFDLEIPTAKDRSEYYYLNELGGILGLTKKEIVSIHRKLSEEAFKEQAKVILADGKTTKAQIDQLNEVQRELGLPAGAAQQVIRSITTAKMAAEIQASVMQGQINIEEIRNLKGHGVDVANMISENLRENLFKKTVKEILSRGTGDFEEEEIYERIPLDLCINLEKAKGIILEMAKNRLSEALVQGVALVRQRKSSEVVLCLNDMVACDKVACVEPLSWQNSRELISLFAIYMKSNPPMKMQSRLQYLLGISDFVAKDVRDNICGELHQYEEEAFVS